MATCYVSLQKKNKKTATIWYAKYLVAGLSEYKNLFFADSIS